MNILSPILISLLCLTHLHCRNWDTIDYEKYCIPEQPENTPCVTKCKIGVNCGEPVTEWKELDLREKQYLLNFHNRLREEVARGDYIADNFPPATNMYVLNYDDECEFMTTCWLRQCNFWHDKHYKPDGTKFGQNLHMRWTTGQFLNVSDEWLDHGMMAWFNEYKLLKDYPDVVKSFYLVPKTGHFTALIWHEVKLVGCAKHHFRVDGKEKYFLYCNYYPASNWMNSPIYGTEPFDCERSKKYPHLCGETKDLIEKGYLLGGGSKQNAKGSRIDGGDKSMQLSFELFIFVFIFAIWNIL